MYSVLPHKTLSAGIPLEWAVATDFALTTKQTNDASVVQPFAIDFESNLYLAEPLHFRMEVPDIIERLLDCCQEYSAMLVGIEKGQIHRAIAPYLESRILEREMTLTLLPLAMPGDKAAKARILQGRMQRGQVFFAKCPFLDELWIPEFLSFGNGARHDDLIDAAAMAAFMVHHSIVPTPPEVQIEEDADAADPWNYENMMKRVKTDVGDRRHVPRTITGDERKRKS